MYTSKHHFYSFSIQARLKMLDKNKRTSLFCPSVSDEEKQLTVSTPSVNSINYFSLSQNLYKISQNVCSCQAFQTNILFRRKFAGACPSGTPFLDHKSQTSLKKIGWYKRTSLFYPSVSDKVKKFYEIQTRRVGELQHRVRRTLNKIF